MTNSGDICTIRLVRVWRGGCYTLPRDSDISQFCGTKVGDICTDPCEGSKPSQGL